MDMPIALRTGVLALTLGVVATAGGGATSAGGGAGSHPKPASPSSTRQARDAIRVTAFIACAVPSK